MIRHTQSRLIPRTSTELAKGNCWQTCVAAILDLPIDALPDQVDVEDAGWSFGNVLSAYLAKHHSMTRVLLYEWQLRAPIIVQPDVHHVMCGPSPRTATNGVNHCVVGRGGKPEWDVHPSRAGLLSVNEMQFLVRVAQDELPEWTLKQQFAGRDCLCPECGGVVPKPLEQT